jgi:hypothetical protein
VPTAMKAGSLILQEPSEPVQAFTGFIYPNIWSVIVTPRAYVWKPYASMVVLKLGVEKIKKEKKKLYNLLSHFVKTEEKVQNLTGY